MMKRYLIIALILGFGILLLAQETDYSTRENISYYTESKNASDKYIAERGSETN